MSAKADLISHLQTGVATTCRAWLVIRKDGEKYGFTDHDDDLEFDGVTFKASTGFTAGALQQSTGMSVDNTEVTGALSDAAISEVDLRAGRFDGAEVTVWLLNWAAVDQRTIRFRGHFGEIQFSEGKFRVELRGLMDALNQTRARVYQPNCAANLGDVECRVDLTRPEFSLETTIKVVGQKGEYLIPSQPNYADGWFTQGRAVVLSGIAKGLVSMVKSDRQAEGLRQVEMWADFNLSPTVGDEIRIEAGCDKLAKTCRTKFSNFLNFRGFPNIPSSDWVTSYPVSSQRNDGGSRSR